MFTGLGSKLFQGIATMTYTRSHTRPSQKDLGCVVYPLNSKSLVPPFQAFIAVLSTPLLQLGMAPIRAIILTFDLNGCLEKDKTHRRQCKISSSGKALCGICLSVSAPLFSSGETDQFYRLWSWSLYRVYKSWRKCRLPHSGVNFYGMTMSGLAS